MSSVEGDYDYEALSPNAGLGVRVSDFVTANNLLTLCFQVHMLAGALVSDPPEREASRTATYLYPSQGWNHGAFCNVSCGCDQSNNFTASHPVGHPLITHIQTRMQVFTASPAAMYTGIGNAFSRISATEGMRSLWRGVSSVILGAGPAHAVHFGTYEFVKELTGGNEEGSRWISTGEPVFS